MHEGWASELMMLRVQCQTNCLLSAQAICVLMPQADPSQAFLSHAHHSSTATQVTPAHAGWCSWDDWCKQHIWTRDESRCKQQNHHGLPATRHVHVAIEQHGHQLVRLLSALLRGGDLALGSEDCGLRSASMYQQQDACVMGVSRIHACRR